jgi:hypothetical protein
LLKLDRRLFVWIEGPYLHARAKANTMTWPKECRRLIQANELPTNELRASPRVPLGISIIFVLGDNLVRRFRANGEATCSLFCQWSEHRLPYITIEPATCTNPQPMRSHVMMPAWCKNFGFPAHG